MFGYGAHERTCVRIRNDGIVRMRFLEILEWQRVLSHRRLMVTEIRSMRVRSRAAHDAAVTLD